MAKTEYFPRLDGLRAAAVSAVLLDHFVHSPLVHSWQPGAAGVRTFFVLSGFLITSILLTERDRALPLDQAALSFFGKRFLRLSPALYIAIALTSLLGIANMRHDWWKHALYLTNFKVAHDHSWLGAGHFWTLSVEEQFYIAWFFVVRCAPKQILAPVILVCLVLGPCYRALLPPDSVDYTAILLPGQVDSLAMGAVLALARREPGLRPLYAWLANRWALASALGLALLLSLPLGWPYTVRWAIAPIFVNLAATTAVRSSVEPIWRGGGGLLAAAPVRHLGRISYGVYVYHYFVPAALALIMPMFADPHGVAEKLGCAALSVVLTLAVAQLSWLFIETPALRFKARLEFDSAGTPMRARPGDQPAI